MKIFESRKKARQSLFKSDAILFEVEKETNHHISIWCKSSITENLIYIVDQFQLEFELCFCFLICQNKFISIRVDFELCFFLLVLQNSFLLFRKDFESCFCSAAAFWLIWVKIQFYEFNILIQIVSNSFLNFVFHLFVNAHCSYHQYWYDVVLMKQLTENQHVLFLIINLIAHYFLNIKRLIHNLNTIRTVLCLRAFRNCSLRNVVIQNKDSKIKNLCILISADEFLTILQNSSFFWCSDWAVHAFNLQLIMHDL